MMTLLVAALFMAVATTTARGLCKSCDKPKKEHCDGCGNCPGVRHKVWCRAKK
jgi:hypothetical protein